MAEAILPEGVEEIKNAAFAYCKALTNVTLPEGLKTIGDGAFLGCVALQNTTIPSTLISLGDEAFLQCESMTAFNIPASLETMGYGVIGLTKVENITVDAANPKFHLVNGSVYNINNSILYTTPMRGMKALTIVEGCRGVGGGACWGSEIETVTFPNSLLAIDKFAFQLSNITELNLPKSVTLIGEQAFAGTKLQQVTLPENVLYILDGTFAQCPELTSVTLPSSIVEIDNHAFILCPKLTTVTALGSKAPIISSYDDIFDSPFHNIGANPTLNIPKGTQASYEAEGWNTFFTLVEGTNGILTPIAVTPNDKSTVSGYQELSFQITFNENVTITNPTPDVTIRTIGLLYPNIFTPDDSWKITLSSDQKTITVWAADYDGFTTSYKFNESENYFIVLPPDMVKNAAGDKNERIVINLVGAVYAGIDTPQTTYKQKKEVARFNINGQLINQAQKGINIIKYDDGTTVKVLVK